MKIIRCAKNEFLNKTRGKKVVLFGVGETAQTAIQKLDIEDRIQFVCDNDINKQGRHFLYKDSVYPICSAKALVDVMVTETILLITSTYYYNEIVDQLNKMPELNDLEAYVYSDFVIQMKPGSDDFFEERTANPCLKWYKSILDYKNLEEGVKNKMLQEKKEYIWSRKADGQRPLVIPRIVFRVTNICTLNCHGCGGLIPYYKERFHYPKEVVLKDIEIFLNAIDQCIIADVTGGETLLYPDLEEVLSALIQSDKVECVSFATNGTVVPSPEILELCKNEKVIVKISDYGVVDKMGQTLAVFEKHGIKPQVLTDFEWIDFGGLEKRGKTNEQMRNDFVRCSYASENKTIGFGKLFTCGRAQSFHVMNLDTASCNHIELDEKISAQEQAERIRSLFESECCTICDHCDMGLERTGTIAAGIQEDGRVEKSDYTIISRAEYEALLKTVGTQQLIQ